MLIDFSHVAFFHTFKLTSDNPHLVRLKTLHLSPSICHINFNVISIDSTCLSQKQLTRFWILDGFFSCTDNAADWNYVPKLIYNNKTVTNNTFSRVELHDEGKNMECNAIFSTTAIFGMASTLQSTLQTPQHLSINILQNSLDCFAPVSNKQTLFCTMYCCYYINPFMFKESFDFSDHMWISGGIFFHKCTRKQGLLAVFFIGFRFSKNQSLQKG